MNTGVLRRFIGLMVLLTLVGFIAWELFGGFLQRAPGDLHTEIGSNRLQDGLYEEAIEEFEMALQQDPEHPGALMGRAIAQLQMGEFEQAVTLLDETIEILSESEAWEKQDDPRLVGTIAAAYANRGIAYDRMGAYEEALESYLKALQIDSEAVEGPGFVDKVIYGFYTFSSVRDRARYLHEQFQLPEEERVMRIPELDEEQRMHKP